MNKGGFDLRRPHAITNKNIFISNNKNMDPPIKITKLNDIYPNARDIDPMDSERIRFYRGSIPQPTPPHPFKLGSDPNTINMLYNHKTIPEYKRFYKPDDRDGTIKIAKMIPIPANKKMKEDVWNYNNSSFTPEIKDWRPLFEAARQCQPVPVEGSGLKCNWGVSGVVSAAGFPEPKDVKTDDGLSYYESAQPLFGTWKSGDNNRGSEAIGSPRGGRNVRQYLNPENVYKKIAFPSEYKFLLDWNNARWQASLAYSFNKDVETTLRHIENIDNDISQHIYSTPLWDNTWASGLWDGSVFDINPPKAGFPYNEDYDISNFDPRLTWRKTFRSAQRDDTDAVRNFFDHPWDTILPKSLKSDGTIRRAFRGRPHSGFKYRPLKETYKNTKYGDGGWADETPIAMVDNPTLDFNNLKPTGNPTTDNPQNSARNKFMGYGIYPERLDHKMTSAWGAPLTNTPGAFRDHRTGVRQSNEDNETSMTTQVCSKHLFDKYTDVHPDVFILEHFGISKEIWFKMIIEQVVKTRNERMVGTAYANLENHFKTGVESKVCDQTRYDRVGKWAMRVVNFVSVVKSFLNVVKSIKAITGKIAPDDDATTTEKDRLKTLEAVAQIDMVNQAINDLDGVMKATEEYEKGFISASNALNTTNKERTTNFIKNAPNYGMTAHAMLQVGVNLVALTDPDATNGISTKAIESSWSTNNAIVNYYKNIWEPIAYPVLETPKYKRTIYTDLEPEIMWACDKPGKRGSDGCGPLVMRQRMVYDRSPECLIQQQETEGDFRTACFPDSLESVVTSVMNTKPSATYKNFKDMVSKQAAEAEKLKKEQAKMEKKSKP